MDYSNETAVDAMSTVVIATKDAPLDVYQAVGKEQQDYFDVVGQGR